MMNGRPRIAILDPNTLAMMGLRQILQNIMPIMQVETYASFDEMMQNDPEGLVHYFVAMNVALENRTFFLDHRHKTIILTTSSHNWLDSTVYA